MLCLEATSDIVALFGNIKSVTISILPQYPIITESLAFGGGVPLWRAVVLARERVAPVEVSLLGAVVDAPQAVHRRELLPEIKSCHVSRIQSGGIFGR